MTDGTPEGTHLVADLKAGPGDSAPINLIDLGGTLYFTANAASAGTQLWSTDGVDASKVQDDPVPGTPTNFVGRLGHADPPHAVEDALRAFGADELISSTPPEGRSHWLERGIVASARERFAVPVTHGVVDLEADREEVR